MSNYNNDFQYLIDIMGTPNILESFADFLGRSNLNIHVPNNSMNRITRNPKIDNNFTGLAFNGAHWKGYENGKMIYESFKNDVQLAGTNNYCQSYACYLWASRGIENTELIKGKYTYNVQVMSKLINKYFKYMESFSEGKEWLIKAVGNDYKKLFNILDKLIKNEKYAHELSTSLDSI